MNLKEFLKEYLWVIGSYIFLIFLFFLFFHSLNLEVAFLILFLLCFLGFGFFLFSYFYYQKKKFYDSFFQTLASLEQKYLITEMDIPANSLETKKFLEALYVINKSMKEELVKLELVSKNFRDYVEMWIHEVKIPIANITLMTHNKEKDSIKFLDQVHRLENLVEQVLYYVRSDNVYQDYLIKKCSLKEVVSTVIRDNKDAFILKHIKVDISKVEGEVLTDQKWLQFILNQIISNSLKYQNKADAVIKISTEQQESKICLKIWDNGMGIKASDIDRVFDKSFTGDNGRVVSTSTGMGLFIVKNLIQKLGHDIYITSKYQEFTEVTIVFYEHDFYDVLD